MKSSKPSPTPTRRQFLRDVSVLTGAVTLGVPTLLRGQNLNSRLNLAAIGVAGKGASDTDCCASENIVALCDVDPQRQQCLDQQKKYPTAKVFQDFRKMFDTMGKDIDAVTVSTPDHFHAIAASAAMQLGKHVYCQKPLTQTVAQARRLCELARNPKLITQMGNQGSASDGLRRAVECVQAGLIGEVSEVHVWSNRPIWPQGLARPEGEDPLPAGLDWDTWIGPAGMRPFKQGIYHPFKWRGWLDFGCGALGDMACHTVNMPFRALQLGHPTEIEGEALGGMNQETYPLGSKIRFEFPARKITGAPAAAPASQAPVTLWWYDGGERVADKPGKHDGSNKPPREVLGDVWVLLGEIPGSGCILIGDKGKVFAPDDYAEQFFLKLNADRKFIHYKKHPAVTALKSWIPLNPHKGSVDQRHHLEWLNAIKEHKPEQCYSRFEIGGQLTEIMLLGCVALRVGKKLEWDGPAMRVTNAPEAEPFVTGTYRSGWKLA